MLPDLFNGFGIPFSAFRVTFREPGLKRYVLIPVLINMVLFAGGFAALWIYRVDLIEWVFRPYPEDSWLWLIAWYVVGVLVFGLTSIMGYFLFTPIGCLIASPFNDALAGRAEQVLDPEVPLEDIPFSLGELGKTLSKEIGKLIAVGLVALVGLLLNLIPGLGSVAALIFGAICGSWVFALEYLDYPMGRHGFGLMAIVEVINKNLWICLGFGAGAMLLLLIPFVNLFCIPVCVVGATRVFVELRAKGKIAQ